MPGNGGTLFLDEISETSPSFQAKLLRFLEEKAFRRVGGSADVRATTVLVVEDEPLVRLSVRHYLERNGYFVLEAGGVNAGLRLLRECRVDLLLTDTTRIRGTCGGALAGGSVARNQARLNGAERMSVR